MKKAFFLSVSIASFVVALVPMFQSVLRGNPVHFGFSTLPSFWALFLIYILGFVAGFAISKYFSSKDKNQAGTGSGVSNDFDL